MPDLTLPLDPADLRRRLFLIAGPCVIEDRELLFRVAEHLVGVRERTGAVVIFKSSYDKANRTSLKGFRGPGLEEGVGLLLEVRARFDLPVLSDVHTVEEAEYAGKRLDVIQIPAFLCRQTDLVLAACGTPAWVNIKKGQFLAPWDMARVAEKARAVKPEGVMLTERGVSFGYNTLVNDMRAIPILKENGCPVVFDGTHSVQQPGGRGDSSGGDRRYVAPLSKAAVAAGAHGLFWETHPDPDNAPSDGPNMLPLGEVEPLFRLCQEIHRVVSDARPSQPKPK